MRFRRLVQAKLVFLLLLPATTWSQTVSFSRTDYASAPAPRGIAAADFNRDGAMDLALVNTGRDSLDVLINATGSGQGFVRTYEIPLGGGPFDIAAADLNGDAVVDIVVANADLNTIDVILGQAAGGFEPPVHIAATGNPRGVAIADVNGDLKLDLVYTQFERNVVQVLDGDGAGNFVARLPALATGPRPQGVVVGLFEGCCNPGIAVATTAANGLSYFRQATRGSFTRLDLYGESPANVLTTADFNHDGRPDIAAVSSATNVLSLYHDLGSGLTFRGAFHVGSSPRGIAAADLNKDGWSDLVTANRGGSNVSILLARNDFTGWFTGPFNVASGSGSRDVVLADFNTDGQMDIATANEFGNSATVLSNTMQPPGGLFWEARALTTSERWSTFLELGDFNGNGVVDILRSGSVLLDGTTDVPLTRGGTTPIGSWTGATGDFNGDGALDAVLLAIVNNTFPQRFGVDIYYGNGAGGFRYAGAFGAFGDIFALETADVNNDGRRDLVLSEEGASGPAGRIQVLFGTATGFVVHNTIDRSATPFSLALDDVNRDGKMDIVAAESFPGTSDGAGVQIFTGDGTGAFALGQFLSSPPVEIDVADLNRDGSPDIVGSGSDPLLAWLGVGDGTFPAPQRSGGSMFSVVVADLTGDGRPDVIGGGEGGAELMRGRGDGTFMPPEPVNIRYFDAEPVDYDRDGRLDLVLVNQWHTMVLYSRAQRGANFAPVAIAGPDRAWGYEAAFDDTECDDIGPSYDPNLDTLTYEWLDANGRIVRTQPTMCLPRLNPGTHTFTLVVRDPFGGESRDSMRITVRPFKESVLYAGWYGGPSGGWQQLHDATAAGESRMWHPNAGAPKLATALAAPTNYFEAQFLADPTQTYKIWIRLKADQNSWANDSVFVQFGEGAVLANGQTRYRAGTTDALDVNLEQCSGCGVSGWGWRDERWGSALTAAPVLLRFPSGGLQRIVVQTREDGVSVDQIVFSSEKYLNAPPGPAKNDATILPPRPW